MADGYIQVPTDSSGKKVDVEEITRHDASVVERQRVKLPDPVAVTGDLLVQMLAQLKINNLLIATAFNITDDLNALKSRFIEEGNEI